MVKIELKFQHLILPEGWEKTHIKHFSFHKARRRKGPLYEAVLKELHEETCQLTAKYFACFILKERRLQREFIVSEEVHREPKLLLTIIKNMKLAEQASRIKSCAGIFTCLTLFYQTLVLVNQYDRKFHWLVTDLFKVLVHITKKFKVMDTKSLEMKSRIFCLYGINLSHKERDYTKSFVYFNKSLDLCRGEYWTAEGLPNEDDYASLHEFAAMNLAKASRKYSKIVLAMLDVHEAIELLDQSIFAAIEVQSEKNTIFLIETYLIKIRILVKMEHYNDALRIIEAAQLLAKMNLNKQFEILSAELILIKGQCEHFLGSNFRDTIEKYKKSLSISKKYGDYEREGQALLMLGKLYVNYSLQKAEKYFIEAKDSFEKGTNRQSLQIVNYAIADIKIKYNFLNLLALLKESETDFCALFKLRRWKDYIQPYWEQEELLDISKTYIPQDPEYIDSIYSQTNLKMSHVNLKIPPLPEISGATFEYTSIREDKSYTRVLKIAKIFKGMECLANPF